MNKTQSSSASKWIQKDKKVWVKSQSQYKNPNEDAFLEGVVLDIDKQHARTLLSEYKQQHRVQFDDLLKLTYGPKHVADMVDLQELNQPELLYNIKRRYVDDMIFTYCGPTLLIINPYVYIEPLFNDTVLHEYQSLVFTDNLQYKNLAPHVFGLSAFCLWQLFDNERNQSIVISGQSGAGKTQNTKYCLKFLASLGKNMKQLTSDSNAKRSKMNHNLRAAEKAIKKTSSKVFGIEQKILGCNQILQAFGNSKTIRNDNSSRFGKLILLVYGQTQIQIKSAFIISYLLEKSRIVSVSQGQRNYHIFYYFCKGTNAQEKKKYMIKEKTSDYYYLNQSSINSIPGVSDEKNFSMIEKQFKHYLSTQEIQAVMTILSIVLNTGNIQFKKQQNKNNQEIAVITNPEYLQIVSKLLQVDFQAIQHCFKFKTRKMGVSVINSPLKYDEALSLRDSFAKNIYEKTFNFLIERLNQKIQIEPINITEKGQYRKSIGLLDIFGFQVLTINSLEQFFINFANEKLQQLYVSYIFKEQQTQFMKQGLKEHTHDIGFQDNKPIIDLFENFPLGIFHLINQSSQLNQNDTDLPESINSNHKKNQFLKIPKSKRSVFQIIHSCSPVSYNTNGFTIKNKDQFPQQLLSIINSSKNQALKRICIGDSKKQPQPKSRSASKKFLGSKFLSEMNKLIDQLYSCDCHFVRCIKPNSKKSPKLFNSHAVLQSLRYLGVLDSIIIRKLGYIYRRPFKEFYKKFYQLDKYIFSYHLDSKGMTQDDFKRQSQRIINKHAKKQLQNGQILFGHKKILIKESSLNHLEALAKQKRKMRINAANRFNAMYKNAIFRTRVRIMMRSLKVLKIHMKFLVADTRQKIVNDRVIKIQNVVKKFLWQRRLQKIKEQATKSVTKISAYYKMKRQRKIFLQTRQKSIRIQASVRSYLTMGKFFRQKTCNNIVTNIFEQSWHQIQDKAATFIKKCWKGYRTRKQYKQAIQTMQKNIRLSKVRAKFKRALFQHKYNLFRQALNKYRYPIIKLQAIVRGRYMQRVYKQVKKNTLLIQKVYRRHLKKKFYLEGYWKEYRGLLSQNQCKKIQQMIKLGVQLPQKKKIKNIEQKTGVKTKIKPSQLIVKYGLQHIREDIQPHLLVDRTTNETIMFADKNLFQVYVGDFDCISNQNYQGSWIGKFIKLKQQLHKKMQFPIHIQVNDNFTTIATNKDRVYRFYSQNWNIVSNQQSNTSVQQIEKIGTLDRIDSGEKGTYIFSQQKKIYDWGTLNIQNLDVQKKSSDSYFSKQLSKKQIIQISQKGQDVYHLNYNGQVSKVTLGKQNQTYQTLLNFPDKIHIKQISSSYFFSHFLSTSGLIFSLGSNKRGELGLGYKSKRILEPTLNVELKKLKQNIETISVGMGHTVAKSKLGYVYLWGNNSFGQIGGHQNNSIHPKKIELHDKSIKAYQAVAGLRSTYLLLQNLKIVALGCSLTFDTKDSGTPYQIAYFQESTSKSKNLQILKINCSWTRQLSIFTVNCLDSTQCKPGNKPDAIFKYCKTIAKQWTQDTIYPEYHQWMDNVLNLSDLRKLKFKSQNSPYSAKRSYKKSQKSASRLQQLKMLIQLRKTSSMFKEAAKTRIQQYMHEIENKKPEKWTQEEKQLFKFIAQECRQILK